mmetsp:Transcript_15804/g.37548  ORF Transcript_15804/g.37548 Transcript_15804/m.37548 type:complete len:1017 (-) Transcript_15804:115-3165(-)
MQQPTPELWDKVPGYSSDDEDSFCSSPEPTKHQLESRLTEVLSCLGSRCMESPTIQFQPVPLQGSKAASKKASGSSCPPPAFLLNAEAPILQETFQHNGMIPTLCSDYVIQWSGPNIRDAVYQSMMEWQRINHFPGSTELTRKDRLWMHFAQMAKSYGKGCFDFVPETYVLPDQFDSFLTCYQRSRCTWIVKPNASSRGRGIFLLSDLSELPLDETVVVSRYIDDPLLIQGFKFDLRVYVLVTSYDPLKAYIYREGLTRFASAPYSTKGEHIQDAFRHLTNYSINKNSESFVENSDMRADNVGHKWSLSALNKHLRCVGVDVNLMWARINDLIVKTLLSVEPSISSRTRQVTGSRENCFELYGFDVLVDNELKPWLLEVNLSPSMQADSPLDWQIKSSLIADSFNLVGINRVSKQRLAEATRAKAKVVKVPGKPPGPPERRRRQAATGRSTLRKEIKEQLEADDEGEDLPPVSLGALEVEELRSTANALLECTRNRNFIRLFPTSNAVRHYAMIVDSQEAMKPWPRGRKPAERLTASQVLASLLFGPPPNHGNTLSRPRSHAILCQTRPERPITADLGEDGGEEASAPLPRAKAQIKVLSRARSLTVLSWDKTGARQRVKGEVDQATSLLQAKGCRLAILEYLIRVANGCSRLGPADRQKASQVEVTARLEAFRNTLPEKDSEEEDDPSVVDRLEDACRATMLRMLRTLYADAGEAFPPGLDGGRISKLLPASITKSCEGRQALEKLTLMTAAELERLLLGSQCNPTFRVPLENYINANAGRTKPTGLLRARSAALCISRPRPREPESCSLVCGPLSELLCLPLTVGREASPKGGRRQVLMKRVEEKNTSLPEGPKGEREKQAEKAEAEKAAEKAEAENEKAAEKEERTPSKALQAKRPQSGHRRAGSRPPSRPTSRPSSSRPQSRPQSRPSSAVKAALANAAFAGNAALANTLQENVAHLSKQANYEQDSLASFMTLMDRTISEAKSRQIPDEIDSPNTANLRLKLLQLGADIEL